MMKVDILGVDILEVGILRVGILGVDILRLTLCNFKLTILHHVKGKGVGSMIK